MTKIKPVNFYPNKPHKIKEPSHKKTIIYTIATCAIALLAHYLLRRSGLLTPQQPLAIAARNTEPCLHPNVNATNQANFVWQTLKDRYGEPKLFLAAETRSDKWKKQIRLTEILDSTVEQFQGQYQKKLLQFLDRANSSQERDSTILLFNALVDAEAADQTKSMTCGVSTNLSIGKIVVRHLFDQQSMPLLIKLTLNYDLIPQDEKDLLRRIVMILFFCFCLMD